VSPKLIFDFSDSDPRFSRKAAPHLMDAGVP
jgi:hypothetical protein